MLRKLQGMSCFERLELAFCITINHPRAMRTLVGPQHAHLIQAAAEPAQRLLPEPACTHRL
jgi:hypothetical protein